MSATIKLRRDTAANWISADPVLSLGEPGIETDTTKVKIGDGITAWTALAYAPGSGVTQYTDALAKAAAVANTITDEITDIAPSQNAVFDALALKIETSYLDTDGTLTANSDTKIATQKAVKTYADQLIAAADAMVYKGVIDCSGNPNYPAADAGHTYKVSVSGKIGGASGPTVEINDTVLCTVDSTATGDHATVGANWNIVQANIDGAVIGPASATDAHIAVFDGATGKLIKDSGSTVGSLGGAEAINDLTDAQKDANGNVLLGVLAPSLSGAVDNTCIGKNSLIALTSGYANTALGTGALKSLTTGYGNIAIGYEALELNTVNHNIALGQWALTENTTGYANIAIGSQTMRNAVTCDKNIAIGYNVLMSPSAGTDNNTAIGYNALKLTTTGEDNVALGTSVLDANTTGKEQVAIGTGALGANVGNYHGSVAVGYNALILATGSAYNVAVGYKALEAVTTGGYNTSLGQQAGNVITTGSHNVSLGDQAGPNAAAAANRISIGYIAQASADNTFVVGKLGTKQAINEGTNAAMGLATLVTGTVTVTNTLVTANSRIFLTAQTTSTADNVGVKYISSRIAGTSFTITSTEGADDADIAWEIKEPN